MTFSTGDASFRSAVSDVKKSWVGHGSTRRKHERRIYYLAERTDSTGENVELRRLGPTWVPLEEWLRTMTPDDFARMRPEPLIYFNKVLPAMQDLAATLDKGDRMREAGRHERAVDFYRQAVRLSPTNIRACFGLGISYLHMDNKENALVVLDQLLEIESAFSPEYKHLFNEFGIALRKTGLHKQALKFYLKARSLSGNDEHLLFNIARLLCEVGDYERANGVLDKALGFNPGFSEALGMRRHVKRMLSQ